MCQPIGVRVTQRNPSRRLLVYSTFAYGCCLRRPLRCTQANLDHILSVRTEMTVFRCSYPVAPNPHLYIAGLGTVGLPLSDRDAEGIKHTAEGETQAGRGIRNTSGGAHAWEIDQTQVSACTAAHSSTAERKTYLGRYETSCMAGFCQTGSH